MSVFITFAAALLIFGAVIAIHEFGHFAVAKLCGVQVNEFSIGMGPTLIKTYRKGTQYTLRLLPVGGFVALEGEESPESEQAEGGSGDDDGPDIPPEVLAQRTGKPLNEAAVWQRMLVMAAGAVMNFVLGFVVLLLLISLRSEPITSKVIYAVEDNALCGQTGLQAGDEIVAVNGRHCFVANDMLYELMRTESYRAHFTVRRDGRLVELPDVRFDTWQDEQGQTHRIGCPKGKVVNSVGAGDSMVAGFVAGYLQSGDYTTALRLGTACGSATAFSLGLAKKEEIEKLLLTI